MWLGTIKAGRRKKIGKEVCENKCGWTRGHGGSGRGKNENLRNENIKPLNLKNMKRWRSGLARGKGVLGGGDRDMQWLVTAALYYPGRPTHPRSAYQLKHIHRTTLMWLHHCDPQFHQPHRSFWLYQQFICSLAYTASVHSLPHG